MAAALLWAPLAVGVAWASGRGSLEVDVSVQGIALVRDLAAQPGTSTGTVSLGWTEPARRGATAPFAYDVRASSQAQIFDATSFSTAALLSAFSSASPPSPGAGGAHAAMTVDGLVPGVTYYFALRETDSSVPPLAGPWWRDVARGWNASSFAVAKFISGAPNAVTDLLAVSSGILASPVGHLTWTAPVNSNGVPLDHYVVKYATFGAASAGGNADAWFALAADSTAIVSPAHSPGTAESVDITGLPPGKTIYFALKAIDVQSEASPVDVKAASIVNQVRLTPPVINLTASPGPQSGSVSLSWTEPSLPTPTPPLNYAVRVSTTGNFSDDAGFLAASPLAVFSTSTPPTPGLGGSTVTFVVTGLTPMTTYYFGLREQDSGSPPSQTDWARDVILGISTQNFSAPAFAAGPPDPVADLRASSTAVQGEISLSWTAVRNPNLAPMASYVVKYASFSIASLGGNATAWFALAPSSVVAPAAAPGSTMTLTFDDLFPLSTFYFAVKGTDVFGEVSAVDLRASGGAQAFSMPGNAAPPVPSGMAATPGLKQIAASWTGLTSAQKGLAFAYYRLWRSTDAVTSFVALTTTTAVGYADKPLAAGVTYFYRVSASQGLGGLESALSSTASAAAFTLAPQEPFGFRVAGTSNTVSISWDPTQRYGDGEPFAVSTAPASDELLGYRVLRSTDICAPSFAQVSTTSLSVTSFTDVTTGLAYFYEVRSFNSMFDSTGTTVVTGFGDHLSLTDDCASKAVLNQQQAYSLLASSNALGGDILISAARRPQDVSDTVMQSVEFKPLLNGQTALSGFHLDKPATIQLHFLTQNGAPSGDNRPLSLAQASAQGAGLASSASENLGIFWFDGQEYRKMYGTVDAVGQTVTVQSPNFGIYQVRRQLRSDSVVFDLSNISGRVITPNGDGRNDVVIFTYDPGPRNVVPDGRIYDLHGAFVATMVPGAVPNTLTWDGMANGRVVTSGVYVYQIKGDGKAFSGTVVVAR